MNFSILKFNQVFIEYLQCGSSYARQWGYEETVYKGMLGSYEKVIAKGLGEVGGEEVGDNRLRPGETPCRPTYPEESHFIL